jgi:hypothetical protein
MVHEGGYIFYPDRGRTPRTLAEVDEFLEVIRQRKPRRTSKSQNARSRPAKVAKALSGPTYGETWPITPPKSRDKRVALAKRRAKIQANAATAAYQMPARKRGKKKRA